MSVRIQDGRVGISLARSDRDAFSLIELMVVVSIVGTVMSLMLPSYKKVREDARRTICVANLKNVGMGLFAYSAENLGFAPQVMARMGTTAPRTLLSRSGRPVNIGLLWPQVVNNPRLFYCASQQKYNFRSVAEELPVQTIGGSYAYAVHVPAEQSPRLSGIRHLAMVSDDFVARNGDAGIGKYAHRVGYNVLYTDGSALWYSDPDESIWKRSVGWDDETDDISYDTLYGRSEGIPADTYGNPLDIFRVWHSFCYSQNDPFGQRSSSGSRP